MQQVNYNKANEIPAVKRKATFEDYDLEEILKRPIQINKTQVGYDRCIKKFYSFIDQDENFIKKEDFTDKNIAVYIYSEGKENEWKPPSKKMNIAAINNQLKYFGLENIFDFGHMYPNTHRIIDVSHVILFLILLIIIFLL